MPWRALKWRALKWRALNQLDLAVPENHDTCGDAGGNRSTDVMHDSAVSILLKQDLEHRTRNGTVEDADMVDRSDVR
jgi:hypothetical protein